MDKILYGAYVGLLPICCLGIGRKYFGGGALNASLLPFIIVLIILMMNTLRTRKVWLGYKQTKRIVLSFFAFCFFLIAYSVLVAMIQRMEMTPRYGMELLAVACGMAGPIIVAVNFLKKKTDFISSLKIIHVTFIILLIYGYFQLMVLFHVSPFLDALYKKISFGFEGSWGVEQGRHVYYLLEKNRINLLTPEGGEAAHLLLLYYYPFLLASLFSGFSAFRSRFGGFRLETIMLLLGVPLLIGTESTAALLVVLLQGVYLVYLSFGRNRKLVPKALFGLVLFLSIAGVVFSCYPGKLGKVASKIMNTNHESTRVRYGTVVASWFYIGERYGMGSGYGMIGDDFISHLPSWGFSQEMERYISTGHRYGPRSLWFRVLVEFGVWGLLLFVIPVIIHFLTNRKLMSSFRRRVAHGDVMQDTKFLMFSMLYTDFALISMCAWWFTSSTYSFFWVWYIWGYNMALTGFLCRYLIPKSQIATGEIECSG